MAPAVNCFETEPASKIESGVSGTFSGSVSGTGGIDGFNVNGTRANQHEFTLDGASNVDTGNNGGTHVMSGDPSAPALACAGSGSKTSFGS